MKMGEFHGFPKGPQAIAIGNCPRLVIKLKVRLKLSKSTVQCLRSISNLAPFCFSYFFCCIRRMPGDSPIERPKAFYNNACTVNMSFYLLSANLKDCFCFCFFFLITFRIHRDQTFLERLKTILSAFKALLIKASALPNQQSALCGISFLNQSGQSALAV